MQSSGAALRCLASRRDLAFRLVPCSTEYFVKLLFLKLL